MPDIRRVTDQLSVGPQLQPADVAAVAGQGFRTLINTRPDDEEPGQPASAEIAQAAAAHGLAYVHLPIAMPAGPTPEHVAAMRRLAEESEAPVMAFCRSGLRALTAWSLGQAASGARSREDLLQLAQDAGYDLQKALQP